MKKPTQCRLWQSENLKSEDLYNAFEVLETFTEDDHFTSRLVRCKECGQLYFRVFEEEINWSGGDDSQCIVYKPVETNDEIETLKKAPLWGSSPVLLHFPALKIVRWYGKE